MVLIIIFQFQTQTILERHLKIGAALNTDQLIEMTASEGAVSMLRGSPGFKFVTKTDESGESYTALEWEDLEARVIRPNLQCNNGYIHVIDKVIMKKRDVTLSKSPGLAVQTFVLVSTIASLFIVQWKKSVKIWKHIAAINSNNSFFVLL